MKNNQINQIAKNIRNIRGFGASLVNPKFAPTGVRVALFVGTILLVLNHGAALSQGRMNQERWISAILTYFVPYMVSIHGQQSGQQINQHNGQTNPRLPKQKR